MAGIWNINSAYNINNKKLSTKLSFDIGEKFSAKIVKLNGESGNILLKRSDGWQFPAFIENPDKISQDQVFIFQVSGFENGKIKLKIVEGQSGTQIIDSDAIELFIREMSMNLSSKDYETIEQMLKHNIPLTKDNISNIKTLMDFMDKLQNNPMEKDDFIQRYVSSKNILLESSEGKFISDKLQDFFTELGKISSKDLFMFIENNIDLNADNIKSFNNIFKKSSMLYTEINNLGQQLGVVHDTDGYTNNSYNNIAEELQKNPGDTSVKEKVIGEYLLGSNISPESPAGKSIMESLVKLSVRDLTAFVENANFENNKMLVGELQKNPGDTAVKEKIIGEYLLGSNISLESAAGKSIMEVLVKLNVRDLTAFVENTNFPNSKMLVGELQKNPGDSAVKEKVIGEYLLGSNISPESPAGKSIMEALKNIFNESNNTENIIKTQINIKTQDMIDIIKQAIGQNKDPSTFKSEIMNDFKIFNTISNSYYYMDIPMKIKDNNYNFKMMIKDERKEGKKIDTTNVKIAASISTENMGIVDAYLAIKNKSMNVDIKSSRIWMKLLERNSKKIVESLSELGYNIKVGFSEKKEEMNISTCREFFQDSELGVINTRA